MTLFAALHSLSLETQDVTPPSPLRRQSIECIVAISMKRNGNVIRVLVPEQCTKLISNRAELQGRYGSQSCKRVSDDDEALYKKKGAEKLYERMRICYILHYFVHRVHAGCCCQPRELECKAALMKFKSDNECNSFQQAYITNFLIHNLWRR